MKKRRSDTAEPRLFLHDFLFGAAGVLFLLVMLTVWLLSGLFAKYAVTDEASGSARAAAFRTVEVLEHEAVLENGEYRLLNDVDNKNDSKKYSEVQSNAYQKVIPGVDIPKDPFVRLNGTAEVDCALYLKVTSSEDFPETIAYEINDSLWNQTSQTDVYKYHETIPSGALLDDIPILKQIGDNHCELKVSENYEGFDENGDPIEFQLTFSIWLVQID